MWILILEKDLFQQVFTEGNGYKIPSKKGKKTSEARVNIQKSRSMASLPQVSLYNRNEETIHENASTKEMLIQPHQSLNGSENTALR